MTVRHVVKNQKREGDKCIVMEWELAVENGTLCVKGGRAGNECGTYYVFSVDEDGKGRLSGGVPDDIGLATDGRGHIILDPLD